MNVPANTIVQLDPPITIPEPITLKNPNGRLDGKFTALGYRLLSILPREGDPDNDKLQCFIGCNDPSEIWDVARRIFLKPVDNSWAAFDVIADICWAPISNAEAGLDYILELHHGRTNLFCERFPSPAAAMAQLEQLATNRFSALLTAPRRVNGSAILDDRPHHSAPAAV